MTKLRHLALLAPLALAACADETLIFNYGDRAHSDTLVADVTSGVRTINGVLGNDPCILNVNTDITSIDDEINGTPGQRGFNMSMSVAGPANRITSNPAGCVGIEDITIFIGDINATLNVGQETSDGRVEVTIGGQTYRSDRPNAYFRARVTSFDSGAITAAGTFEAMARTFNATPERMVTLTGSFDIGG